MFEVIALLCVVGYLIYYILSYEKDYWKTRKVPNAPGKLLFGNMGPVMNNSKSMSDVYTDIYREFESYKYCGVLNFRKPAILIRDAELIKSVLIKDFNSFHDNWFEVDEKRDPILANNPFFSTGAKWKQIRTQISPQFTAGKVKKMFPLIEEVCQKLETYLENEEQAVKDPGLNAKELGSQFTAEVVSSCAFGLDGKSFVDPKAEIRDMAKKLFAFNFLDVVIQVSVMVIPELKKLRVPTFLSKKITDWFRSLVLGTIKDRQQKQIKRDDFLDIVQEMKNNSPYEYTEDHMVAHCLTFFIDGYETSAVVIQFALYELSANLDVQAKLREEVENVLSKYDGKLTYEAIQEMTYLDMVFLETLRKYPPLLFMSRICTENIVLPPPDEKGKELRVEKGMVIIIPVYAIHFDPTYYPDPDKFDPERFSEDMKNSRPKQVFLGFGDGPRICLGQRFATTQVKAALIAIISNFEVHLNGKTKLPLKFDPKEFLPTVVGGIWLNFSKRNSQK